MKPIFVVLSLGFAGYLAVLSAGSILADRDHTVVSAATGPAFDRVTVDESILPPIASDAFTRRFRDSRNGFGPIAEVADAMRPAN